MRNEYEIRGNTTAIFIDSSKYGNIETLISTSKLEEVKNFPNSWRAVKQGNSLYVISHTPRINGKRKNISLHRLIMGYPNGFFVDHINHDGLNNTNENLRIVTHAENGQNRKGAASNNKSGIRGVYLDKKTNKWRAHIMINKRGINLGSYDDIHDAEQAAVQARMKYLPFSNEIIG